jgi:acyl carrier protein
VNNRFNEIALERSKISDMVISSLQDVLAMNNGDSPAEVTIGEDTHLIGRESVLDSMGLVTLIVELEQLLEEEYDVAVVLADERAMSQKNSPFRSVQTLTDYICRLIEEQS